MFFSKGKATVSVKTIPLTVPIKSDNTTTVSKPKLSYKLLFTLRRFVLYVSWNKWNKL